MQRLHTLFTAHPRAVNETYGQHFGVAAGFGFRMIGGGLACLVHAVLPFAFTRTGSRTIAALHSRLSARQDGAAAVPSATWSSGPGPSTGIAGGAAPALSRERGD